VGADRRSDPQTRTRVEDLTESWHNAVTSLETRYKRVARFLTIGMIVSVTAFLIGFALLQGQRWDAVKDGCDRTNQQTEAALGLLADLHVRQPVIDAAKKRYPHVEDCTAYANNRVGWLRL
jgi:hypothetical protein